MAIDINIPSQVKTYANLAGFPATGSLKTIFIAEDTNKTYRWTGSAYVEISSSQAAAWGAIGGTLSNQTDLQTALNAKVTGNTAITGATKTKITYDSKGLVTSGADATTADIADSTNKRYVTDANLTVIGNTSGVNTGDQTLSGLGGVPTTRTLTINGTTQDLSADRTFTISTGITIGTTAITSGTVGRVLFEGTGNVVQESANLFWDNTNGRLGIGGTPGAFSLDVNGTARVQGLTTIRTLASSYNSPLIVENTGSAAVDNKNVATFIGARGNASNIDDNTNIGIWQKSNIVNNYGIVNYFNSAGNLSAYFGAQYVTHGANPIGNLIFGTSNGSPATRMTIFAGGNIGINTTTDAGYKLDVNGTARFTGNVSLGSPNINDKLEVYGNILVRANDRIRLAGTSDGNTALWANSGASAQMNVKNGSASAFDITFGSIGSTTRMVRVNAYDSTTPSVAIGNNATSFASAVLSADSTTQGFLPPRMTTTQKNAIATPATGLMVYDTTLNLISVYNGTTWITL